MQKLITYLLAKPKLTLSLAIFWTIGIFWGCSRPGKDLPKLHLFDNIDKVIHFVFFFVFALLWAMVLFSKKNNVLISIVVAIFYGVFIELYQKYFVAGRSFDVWDIVADAIGAISILLIMHKKNQSFLKHL
jgi:VanZ family protein